ncbi:Ribonuclease VapC22 [Pontiella sulfatireligans]|uniref:Ribonuclease VapC22 n=1 Tax=Pontiella sulfatireligans TaxID=2750658 RepID=A0A6C2UEI4_9BACT|nr:Ribonuclease VapC22 [Pontiella sulfatireligans]
MIYLDTHVVVWLYAGEFDRFPASASEFIEQNNLLISPAVLLELQFLKEIKRITADPMLVFQTLEETIGLQLCKLEFYKVVVGALSQSWTRDPFDRLIAAQASIRNASLLTKDRIIRRNCSTACW